MPITLNTILQSILSVFINSLVMLIGVYFMNIGWINLTSPTSFLQVITQSIVLILIMDFLLFIFHYLAHLPFFYTFIHYKHHEHIQTNFLSLFVLHPIEALGFGLLLLAVLLCYNFSVLSIFCYILINIIWGTIGHLNREFFPKWVTYIGIGTSSFHHEHHINEAYNFGFYTSVWDKLFKTYKK